MRHASRVAVLGLLAVVVGCEGTPVAVDEAPLSLDRSKIGPGVVEALQQQGSARVIVALRTDGSAQRFPSENRVAYLARVRAEVEAAQRDVFSRLDAEAFMTARQYEAVPALTGVARDASALAVFAADPRVVRIDLDVGGTGLLGNSVPFIGADQRHALGNDGEGVVVAILDTGMDTDHPDLSDDVLQQACFGDTNGTIDGVGFCPNGSDRQTGLGAAEDDAGHGTHVSGIVTSNGTVSAPGTAPGAGIVPIKVLNNCAFSGCFFFFSEIVAALNHIIINNAELGVQVINMSLGTFALFTGNCDNSTAFNMAGAAAINTLRGMGVIAFASSGNNGSGTQMPTPACLSNVVSVGATDNADNVASFANSNATTDIFAPGVSVVSLAISGGTTTASGTSMASPHAAGCAALLIQSGEATTPAQIETRLETSAFQVTDPTNGLTFPRIDCSPGNAPPSAGAGGPYFGDEAVGIPLSGATASDPDGDPLTISWSVNSALCGFSDATVLQPTLTCDDNGSFEVTLTVSDGSATVEDDATVTVNNVAPTIGSFTVAPATIVVGQGVDAAGSFSDVPADVLTATVDWDDGTSTGVGSPFGEHHDYLQSGNYDVRLTVVDDDLGSTSRDVAVTVLSPAQAIEALMAMVDGLGLVKNTERSYLAILRNALRSVQRGNTRAATNQLRAFLNQVRAQRGKKMSESDADGLSDLAEAIIAALRAGLS